MNQLHWGTPSNATNVEIEEEGGQCKGAKNLTITFVGGWKQQKNIFLGGVWAATFESDLEKSNKSWMLKLFYVVFIRFSPKFSSFLEI